MEKLIREIEEILEVEELDANKRFIDYEEWDSLCGLAIIALLDSDYDRMMTTKELMSYNSIKEFCESVIK